MLELMPEKRDTLRNVLAVAWCLWPQVRGQVFVGFVVGIHVGLVCCDPELAFGIKVGIEHIDTMLCQVFNVSVAEHDVLLFAQV